MRSKSAGNSERQPNTAKCYQGDKKAEETGNILGRGRGRCPGSYFSNCGQHRLPGRGISTDICRTRGIKHSRRRRNNFLGRGNKQQMQRPCGGKGLGMRPLPGKPDGVLIDSHQGVVQAWKLRDLLSLLLALPLMHCVTWASVSLPAPGRVSGGSCNLSLCDSK